MPPLIALYAWLRQRAPRARSQDALLLLALLMTLRCVLDPWDISYYSLPFLFALTSWEAVSVERPPVASLLATFAAWFILRETGDSALDLAGGTQALIFIAVSVPGVIAIAVSLFVPGAGRLLTRARTPAEPAPTARESLPAAA